MSQDRPIGMGCMRLSTRADRDDEAATAVIHAALDAGVTLLDTADAYCHDARDADHNERLIAGALAGWSGDRSRVCVATKGGLTRPGGRWVPDGRAKALERACEASRRALGVDRIDLYQLHAPDPRTPFRTSVRALARLRKEGLVRDVGLCNVTVGQIEAARRIVPVAAVQVALSVLADEALRNGVAEYCREHAILLIAHSPLGGPKKVRRIARHPVLQALAAGKGTTPEEVALAWARDLDPCVVPIPGATRPETARSAVRGQRLALDAEDRARLDAAFEAGRRFRQPRSARRPSAGAPRGVVLIMGYPAAGKSTAVEPWVERGYERLNRDQRGGTLADLARELEAGLAAGRRRFVLDNTYPTRASRNAVIEAAWEHGVNVRCEWLQTSLEEAQVNAVFRMLARHGRLLDPDEIQRAGRSDPGIFPPQVQFNYRSALEPPVAEEGFAEIVEVPFRRRRDPGWDRRALILELDGVVRSKPGARAPVEPDGVEVLPGRSEVLRRHADDGWLLLGVAWQPEVEDGAATADDVEEGFEALRERLGVDLDVAYCPHRAGPPRCWCRRPLPGLGVVHVVRHRLDPVRCLFVGSSATDRTFARRLGFPYADADEAFGEGVRTAGPG